MDTYKIFIKLYRRLMSQSVFYVPSELIVDEIQEMFNFPLNDYADQLLYLSKDRNTTLLQNPEALENIIAKRFQLERTVSYLLRQKSIMDEGSYTYLQEKYMEQVNVACYVSTLLCDNVKAYFPNETLVLYNSFLAQQNAMDEHRNELVKMLKITNNQPYRLEDITNLSLLKNPTVKEAFSLQSKGLQRDGLEVRSTDGIAIISDEAARDFLLETVFSIPLKKIQK
ncbi:hypothetical protein [Aequorivita soesokkakensis]|nr:hypothetical protein [Aequorivita soesokkakensis]